MTLDLGPMAGLRALGAPEPAQVQSLLARVRRHDFAKDLPEWPRALLLCASFDVDVGLTTAAAGCMGDDLHSYYFISAGGGLSLGVSGNVFAIAFYSHSLKDVSGVYRGSQFGLGLERVGVNTGYYVRRDGRGRIVLIGWTGGGSIDISAGEIRIGRVSDFGQQSRIRYCRFAKPSAPSCQSDY